jgi:hypothetical protein
VENRHEGEPEPKPNQPLTDAVRKLANLPKRAAAATYGMFNNNQSISNSSSEKTSTGTIQNKNRKITQKIRSALSAIGNGAKNGTRRAASAIKNGTQTAYSATSNIFRGNNGEKKTDENAVVDDDEAGFFFLFFLEGERTIFFSVRLGEYTAIYIHILSNWMST